MTGRLLYDDTLAPLTSTLGFIGAPVDEASEAFARWQASIHGPLGSTFSRRAATGGFPRLLEELLPLTAHERRRSLFVDTRNPQWTAYFDNGDQGSAAPPCSRCAARAEAIPAGVEREIELLDDGGRWRFHQDGPALSFEDTTAYTGRRIRDRFPPALLRRMGEPSPMAGASFCPR